MNLLKGSLIILIGNVIFRIGGYLYRMLMQYLLGVEGYGILSIVLPVQWVLILVAAAGLPPAIAKYVAEYKAKNDFYMVKMIIFTSIKIMLCMGLIFSASLYYFAPYLAHLLNTGPSVVFYYQLIGILTPFTVLLGLLRGVFQGYQKMTYILITRAAEQIFMIMMAVLFILAGYYVLGAVIGSILGFAASSLVAILIFKIEIWRDIQNIQKPEIKVSEFTLVKKLLFFSFPVIIAGLSELALFDTGTMIIKIFMDATAVGYYNIASPVARLPLIISTSVSVAILPAASEALSINAENLLRKYVIQSYRYLLLVLIPICLIVILFAEPILQLLFPRAPMAFLLANNALVILVVGMGFYSIYGISASISQGVGKPYLPMIFLIIGSVINLALTLLFVPKYGITGAAVATTISAFVIMITSTYSNLKITKTKLPYLNFFKIILSSLIVGVILFLFPKNIIGLVFALIVVPILYSITLSFIKALNEYDIVVIHKIGLKTGYFSPLLIKFSRLLNNINNR